MMLPDQEPQHSSSQLFQDIKKSRLLKEYLRATAIAGELLFGSASAHSRIMQPSPEYQCSREFRYSLRLNRNRLGLIAHTAILIHVGFNAEVSAQNVVIAALNLYAVVGIATAHMSTRRGLARFMSPYKNLTL